MIKKDFPPIHPGEILQEEFLKLLNISQNQMARAMHVPPDRINAIVNGKRSISADTALRLAKALGTTPQFWMNLQSKYDLETALDKECDLLEREIALLIEQPIPAKKMIG